MGHCGLLFVFVMGTMKDTAFLELFHLDFSVRLYSVNKNALRLLWEGILLLWIDHLMLVIRLENAVH
jgi:hypothetical protein